MTGFSLSLSLSPTRNPRVYRTIIDMYLEQLGFLTSLTTNKPHTEN